MYKYEINNDRVMVLEDEEVIGELAFAVKNNKLYISLINCSEKVEAKFGGSLTDKYFAFLRNIGVSFKEELEKQGISVDGLLWCSFSKVRELDEIAIEINNEFREKETVKSKGMR